MKNVTETTPATLWALHIEGPDDIYAMPSEEAAQEHARILNDHLNSTHHDGTTSMRGVAVRWPYSAQAHADDMKKNLKDFS